MSKCRDFVYNKTQKDIRIYKQMQGLCLSNVGLEFSYMTSFELFPFETNLKIPTQQKGLQRGIPVTDVQILQVAFKWILQEVIPLRIHLSPYKWAFQLQDCFGIIKTKTSTPVALEICGGRVVKKKLKIFFNKTKTSNNLKTQDNHTTVRQFSKLSLTNSFKTTLPHILFTSKFLLCTFTSEIRNMSNYTFLFHLIILCFFGNTSITLGFITLVINFHILLEFYTELGHFPFVG